MDCPGMTPRKKKSPRRRPIAASDAYVEHRSKASLQKLIYEANVENSRMRELLDAKAQELSYLTTQHEQLKLDQCWQPKEVCIGTLIISHANDYRLQHNLLKLGENLRCIETNTRTNTTRTITTTNYYREPAIVLAANGKMLAMIYRSDLAWLRTTLFATLASSISEMIHDPFKDEPT